MEFVKPTEKPTANVFLYGPPKSGKTIGACTAPPGVLLFNTDIGNSTRQAHLRHPDGSIMEPYIAPYQRGTKPVMNLMIEIMKAVTQPQDIIQSVVVDPIGELYRRLLEEASDRAIRPTLNQYGDVGTHIERFCRALCEAPINAVFVAHELAQKDEETGAFERIAFTGSKSGSEVMSQKLMGMVDIVGYTGPVDHDDGTREWMAQLIHAKGRKGGDRFNCLGNYRRLDISEWVDRIAAYERGEIHEAAPPDPPEPAPPSDPMSTLTQGSTNGKGDEEEPETTEKPEQPERPTSSRSSRSSSRAKAKA